MVNWFQDLPGLIENNSKTEFPPELLLLPYEKMLDLPTPFFHVVYWLCANYKERNAPSLRLLFDSLSDADGFDELLLGFSELLAMGYIQVQPDDHDESSYAVSFTHHCEVALRNGNIEALNKKCKSVNLDDRETVCLYASAVLFKCRIIDADAWVATCDSFLAASDIKLSRGFKKCGFDKLTNAIALYVTLMRCIEGAPTEIRPLSQLFSINSMEARRMYRKFKSPSWRPIQKGMLVMRQFPMGPVVVCPTEDFISQIEGTVSKSSNDSIGPLPSSLIRMSASSIKTKKLFYNSAEDKEIELLKKILQPTVFKKYCQQQEQQIGGQSGLVILLHGAPGTGKTELGRQLAKSTGRDLLFLNVSEQRDKYYSESEKKIKQVFDFYKKVVDTVKKEPILFFNEADSVIHKRHSGNSSTSNTENVVQTILLNELENFTGILICTTNRPDSFDEAFNRRFPTQIAILPPDTSTRASLLQHYFNELSEKVRNDLANRYAFTAAELDNFLRRNLMVQAVGEVEDPLEKSLEAYLLTLGKVGRSPIGYKL